jgi:hypothetical protein
MAKVSTMTTMKHTTKELIYLDWNEQNGTLS